MPLYKTEAIALKSTPVGDAHSLVWFFTRERGRIRALAQGIKRMKSSLAAATQPLSYSFVSLAQGRKRDILTQAEVKDFFSEIRADLQRLSVGLYLADLVMGATAIGQKDEKLFKAILWTLSNLRDYGDLWAVISVFELQLLEIHGVPFNVRQCALCGERVGDTNWFMKVEAGGRVCGSCRRRISSLKRVSPAVGECLSNLDSTAIDRSPTARVAPEVVEGVRGTLTEFLEYHLGQRFRSREFMNSALGLSGVRAPALS